MALASLNGARLKLNRAIPLLFMGLLVGLVLTACLGNSGPDPCNEDGTLLNDDFEGEKECGWILYEGRGVTTRIEEGALRLSNSLSGEIAWANAGKDFDDIIIDVETTQVVRTPLSGAQKRLPSPRR